MKPTLYDLVLRASKRLGTSQALADACELALSSMMRGAKTNHLSSDSLFAIAEMGGEDPLELLRAAGKGATASRILRLFGPPRPAFTAYERRLLALDEDSKRQLCRLIDGLTK